ncbi:hypothetical protein AX774_g1012 [Zancudomyces culisetae]|uniref:WHEP-TRS domain-containing protein n=1 Tax=Zancudomyces culisetae TaxID=1213189 RepID=A0A1R1PWY9_ZANCU|nr:hypothetical protein AX774_g1012 [Zancudomyces culisetae]|eukprot:OMH85444.1 hypothetical protein AX774_g1012 [Zancudomyces culisetae]
MTDDYKSEIAKLGSMLKELKAKNAPEEEIATVKKQLEEVKKHLWKGTSVGSAGKEKKGAQITLKTPKVC